MTAREKQFTSLYDRLDPNCCFIDGYQVESYVMMHQRVWFHYHCVYQNAFVSNIKNDTNNFRKEGTPANGCILT